MYIVYSHVLDCGTVTVDNGNVDLSSGTLLGDIASITCNAGHDLVGTSTLECQVSGWIGSSECAVQGIIMFDFGGLRSRIINAVYFKLLSTYYRMFESHQSCEIISSQVLLIWLEYLHACTCTYLQHIIKRLE